MMLNNRSHPAPAPGLQFASVPITTGPAVVSAAGGARFRQRQRRVLKPAWGSAPGGVSEDPIRAEGPFYRIGVRYSPKRPRCRTDGPRRWRSRFFGADNNMGRWPMLVLDGPLALAAGLSRCDGPAKRNKMDAEDLNGEKVDFATTDFQVQGI